MIPSLNKTDFNFDIPKKYILYVGSRAVYKNFDSFIKASAPLLKMDPELFIVTSGGYQGNDGFSASELKLITLLGIAKQVKSFSVNDKELSFLYENALCFVFPTLYEGFGFPVLEALAAGAVVVLSEIPGFRETAADAGVFCVPGDVEGWVDVIRGLLNGSRGAPGLSIRSDRARRFSWTAHAAAVSEAYLRLAAPQ